MMDPENWLSFTVRTATEFREAIPYVDQVPLLLDATRRRGETEKRRQHRLEALMAALFERYSVEGRLTRDVNILVEAERGELKNTHVYPVNADGTVGEPIGRVISRKPLSYSKARREGQSSRPVSLTLGDTNRCPTCLRLVDEWWRFQCRGCDCGWNAIGCLHCLSPEALACLDGRVPVE